MSWKKQQIEFLKKLNDLTKETGIAVGGCGCCGSPFLIKAEQHEEYCYNAELEDDGNFSGIEWQNEYPITYLDNQ